MPSNQDYLFQQVDHIGESLQTAQLEGNIIAWLNWSFLNIGAFNNIEISTPSIYGSTFPAKLRPVKDPRGFTNGQIWEGPRRDWVWESGIPYSGQPISISGVYVTGNFIPASSTGTYYINYPLGQVVFSTPIATGLDVKVAHSYRTVQVKSADQPWFQHLVFDGFREDNSQFSQPPGSGGPWDILAQNRVELPCILIEPVDRVKMVPLEIGNTARTQSQDVLCHIFTETPWDRKTLHDILINQYDKRFPTFDKNEIPYPLDYRGVPVSGAKTYPELCSGYPWQVVQITNVSSSEFNQLGEKLYLSTVRWTCEFDMA